jgi:hypothetical protein
MTIWRDIGVRIFHKIPHIKKIGGKTFNSFTRDFGDVPVFYWNTITKKAEAVVNPRGRAYAARRRFKYRKNLKKEC